MEKSYKNKLILKGLLPFALKPFFERKLLLSIQKNFLQLICIDKLTSFQYAANILPTENLVINS